MRSCTLAAARFSCQVQTTCQRADEFSILFSILFSVRTSRKRKGFYNFELTAQNTLLWVTSRSNRGGNGALNCLSFICLLLSLISTSCGAWREHEPLFQREHVQVQRFYSTMVLHSFHKFTLVCVCWSSPEKNKVSRSSQCLTFTSCFTLTSEINFKVNL